MFRKQEGSAKQKQAQILLVLCHLISWLSSMTQMNLLVRCTTRSLCAQNHLLATA